jgi:hypothetical protein
MSQENVEVVRRALEASTRRDNEATFGLYDPEVRLRVYATKTEALEAVGLSE